MAGATAVRTVRVHLSIDDVELAHEADAVRRALTTLRADLGVPDVRGADVFVGVYGDRYGDIDVDQGVSRLEADYLAAGRKPRLVYVMPGTAARDDHLALLLKRIQADDTTSYRRVRDADELARLVADDVSMVLMEAFTGKAQSVSPTIPAQAPAVEDAPAKSPRSRIPAPWHRLVGRDREADEVCRLITHEARLVSLTGPGGIGKSRLAIEVATRCEERFRDGAWFVDLAGVRDPALVAPTVAHALGVRESAGALPVQSLKSYLASMEALILLDSFENVTTAAPLVLDLLASAPGVRFFVTSRSVLRVRGEQEYPLPPLRTPDAGDTDPAHSPALELFLERAAAANPHRAMSDADRVAAAEICRRLDGVPLSLELAAARTRLLPPTALLGRLAHALDLLGDGPLDLPERQRALRTTLDWDHQLLSEEEQVVFRRLSVFPRDFTLWGAEAAIDEPALDVLDLLDSLVGKSLVRTTAPEPGTGQPAFVMLSTIREYAHEHLEAAGEAAEVHARHAHGVLRVVERAARNGPAELEGWLGLLEHHHDDIRTALDWTDRNRDVDTLLRLAAALGPFWRAHCHFSEGRRWLDRALALSSGQRTDLRSDLLNGAAYLSRARGDYDVAESQYRESLEIREAAGDQAAISASLRFLGNVAFDRGDVAGAEDWWRRSLRALDGVDDIVRRASVLNNLGVAAHHRGADDEAIALYDQVQELAQQMGSVELLARARMNTATALLGQGQLDRAARVARDAVEGYATLDDTWDLVDAVDVLASALGLAGDAGEAGWLYGGAAGLRAALDVRRPVTEERAHRATLAQVRAIDESAFTSGYSAGCCASLDQIVERARSHAGQG
ncbi:MAG TPA: tetratricopeptide repeat protein [Candidatus Nanopelagicales bacterium]|nr:tetratricopeptide repeat protein [Candidatus Nanopelagicales bacterium]